MASELVKVESRFTIDPKVQHLIKVYTATMSGCAFCVDIGKASVQHKNLDPDIFDDLMIFDRSDRFSLAEKAAFFYVDKANRNKPVSDETFRNLQQYFNGEEIIQITLINAIESFYNLNECTVEYRIR